MDNRRVQRWLVGLIALSVLGMSACTGPSQQQPRADTPHHITPSDSGGTTATSGTGTSGGSSGHDLRATVTQYRLDEGSRSINAQLTNHGVAPVTVTGVRLIWAGARRLPPTPKQTVLGPGQTVDLRTRYGSAYCRELPHPHAAVGVTTADAEGVLLAVDRSGRRLLQRLAQGDCAARQLRHTASIELRSSYRQVVVGGEEMLRGSLIVRRVSASPNTAKPVYVEDLLGSVLLTFRPAVETTLPAELPPGDRALNLPVLLGSTHRCDAHALSQSSQTFLLSVFARVGKQPTQRLIVSPDRAAQARAGALLDSVCD